MPAQAIGILMYHSLSAGAAPVCIAPETFREQLAALAECGYRTVSLAHVAGWLRGESELSERSVVLTFDDGFDDFATVAFPELHARGWTATVFLPSGKVGGAADWEANAPGRLMSWPTVAELARAGIDFGAHTVSHADLTALPPAVAHEEIVGSKRQIEDQLGRPVTSFAAPYGRTTRAVRAEIGRHYAAAVSTRLARVRPASDPHDLPRIEMWYFRNPRRWRAYLQGSARAYFNLRRVLRGLRTLAPYRLPDTAR
jgi:peptidoglycan/xylan/chitin deacetylase (PgdA/CDA1 family)